MADAWTNVLQELYDSEINVRIVSFWDDGYSISLGDEMNGFKAEFNTQDWAEAEEWLISEACRIWPDSVFAKKCKAA